MCTTWALGRKSESLNPCPSPTPATTFSLTQASPFHHDGWAAAAEGDPPRSQPLRSLRYPLHCRPGYPLAAEDALEDPGLQYHHPRLPVAVEASRPARAPAEEEEGGRLLAHEPPQRRTHSRRDDQCQHVRIHGTSRLVLVLLVNDLHPRWRQEPRRLPEPEWGGYRP